MSEYNGTGSNAWAESWTHLRVDRRSPGYCRVTFDHPPINTITATTVVELAELVGLIEEDPDLNVVVFDSANSDFYLAHYDVEHDPGRTAALGVGPTGMHAWLDLLVRLSRAPVVSIASIRGRARGAGSEFVLACDLRFASRENTLLGQFEVGAGVVPGGGPMARLSRLVGRGRALEILLVADDVDGPRAEQYGYVNRVIADDRLDDEVDQMASRLARFDHDAIARTKSYVDRVTLPADSEFPPALADFFEMLGRPEQRAQSARLEALGLNVDSDLERSLGRRVVEALPDAWAMKLSAWSRSGAFTGASGRRVSDSALRIDNAEAVLHADDNDPTRPVPHRRRCPDPVRRQRWLAGAGGAAHEPVAGEHLRVRADLGHACRARPPVRRRPAGLRCIRSARRSLLAAGDGGVPGGAHRSRPAWARRTSSRRTSGPRPPCLRRRRTRSGSRA